MMRAHRSGCINRGASVILGAPHLIVGVNLWHGMTSIRRVSSRALATVEAGFNYGIITAPDTLSLGIG